MNLRSRARRSGEWKEQTEENEKQASAIEKTSKKFDDFCVILAFI